MSSKKAWKSLLVFSFLMVGLFTASYGQFAKGTKAAGGGIGFVSETHTRPTGENVRQNSFQLHLNGGFMFQENLEAGMNLGFSSSSSVHESLHQEERTGSSLFQFGPYARAYYTVTDVVGLFGEGNLNLGFGGGPNEIRTRTFELGVRPGVILMVNENIGLEAKLGFVGYQRSARGVKGSFADVKSVNNSFRASFDMSNISFGFRLYLNN